MVITQIELISVFVIRLFRHVLYDVLKISPVVSIGIFIFGSNRNVESTLLVDISKGIIVALWGNRI